MFSILNFFTSLLSGQQDQTPIFSACDTALTAMVETDDVALSVAIDESDVFLTVGVSGCE
jgi:hypothetical protein